MRKLDFNPHFEKPLPTYAQLVEAMKNAIARRSIAPGARLPDERQLARQFALSRGTIRRALAQLEQDGLLMRQQGRGTFVVDRNDLPAVPLAVIANGQIQTGKDFGGRVVEGMVEAASRLGAEVLLRDPGSPSAGARSSVDPAAMLFLFPLDQKPVLAAAKTRPVVSVDYRVDGARIDSVVYDNRSGGSEAVRRLAAAGHRRIAYIDAKLERSGKLLDEPTSLERMAGYRDGLRAEGISEEIIWPIALETRDVRREFPRFFNAAHSRPTAIFAFDDAVALGVWMAAAEMGLRIPDDLSVVCFRAADVPDAGGVDWSSVALSARAMGAAAVEAAMGRVMGLQGHAEGDLESGRTIIVPHRWSEGETCRPLKH